GGKPSSGGAPVHSDRRALAAATMPSSSVIVFPSTSGAKSGWCASSPARWAANRSGDSEDEVVFATHARDPAKTSLRRGAPARSSLAIASAVTGFVNDARSNGVSTRASGASAPNQSEPKAPSPSLHAPPSRLAAATVAHGEAPNVVTTIAATLDRSI